MAKGYVLASVGDVDIFKPDGEYIMSGDTLTQANMNFSVTEQEVRGGFLNSLICSYFTDSSLQFELNNAVFNLESVALNTGASIEVGGDILTIETVTITDNGKITVGSNPQNFTNVGKIGWVSAVGEGEWTKVDFIGKDAVYASAKVGEKYCVKYFKEDLTCEQITISSAFVPAQCSAIIKYPLFKTGSSNVSTDKAQVGHVEVEIPLAQFLGNMALSLSANGNATVPLSFKALKSNSGAETCDGTATGEYAKMKLVIYDKDEFDDIKNIVVENSDVELETSETQVLSVLAVYNGIKAPRKIENSQLTFTSGTPSVATVGANTGVVEAVGSGTSIIEVVVTGKPNLVAKAVVEVG